MMLLALLLACHKATAPVLFPTPQPELVAPSPLEWEVAGDECLQVEPVKPGQPVPSVVEGLATCRGLLVPESQFAELLYTETAAAYWEPRARECVEGRERDRVYAQGAYTASWESSVELERENAGLRAGGVAVGVGLFVLGAGIGVGAARVGAL